MIGIPASLVVVKGRSILLLQSNVLSDVDGERSFRQMGEDIAIFLLLREKGEKNGIFGQKSQP